MSRPTVENTPREVEAIFRSLPDRFRPERAAEFAGTYHFEIKGADKPAWTVDIAGGECDVKEGHEGEACCTVRMTEKTFLVVETGERNPVFAFVKGKIKVTNVGALRRYDRAFYKLYDLPKPGAT